MPLAAVIDPGTMAETVETSMFDNIDDLNLELDGISANDEWLDLMRSEFEDNVVQQVLKPEPVLAPAMRRCGSVPVHMQFMDKTQRKSLNNKPSALASHGSARNLTSMCSEVTITPTGSVPDLLEFERRATQENCALSLIASGSYSPGTWSREDALMRYKRKRANRCFRKKIRYECRRKIASDRPRVGGRFARTDEELAELEEMNKYVNLVDNSSA